MYAETSDLPSVPILYNQRLHDARCILKPKSAQAYSWPAFQSGVSPRSGGIISNQAFRIIQIIHNCTLSHLLSLNSRHNLPRVPCVSELEIPYTLPRPCS